MTTIVFFSAVTLKIHSDKKLQDKEKQKQKKTNKLNRY